MSKTNLLDRREVVATLLASRKGTVAVGGLGASTNDITAAGDHPRNFYLWGGMGGAAMIGLGLALAQPEVPVLVITGDGEMLMGLGSLATIGLQRPANLSIVVPPVIGLRRELPLLTWLCGRITRTLRRLSNAGGVRWNGSVDWMSAWTKARFAWSTTREQWCFRAPW